MNRTVTAALLIAAAVLTNVAFTALGFVFNYPDVLKEPVEDILTAFRASQGPVTGWFTVLAVSAALFAPIAVGVGRLSTRPAMRIAVPVGVSSPAGGSPLGGASAVLIFSGVLSPLDLPAIDMANFAGYILWSVWLITFAVLLLRGHRADTETSPARQLSRTAR